jgi:hypothetical protein
MNATKYNQILTVYNELKAVQKRVTKNDVLIQSLFKAGGTLDLNDIELFFKIKKSPQRYFFNQMYIKGVNVFASGIIKQGRKKVGAFLRFDTVQSEVNINDFLINDKIYINKVGMNYAPEIKTNTCYCIF